jgi:large subunit ribosomal protein L35
MPKLKTHKGAQKRFSVTSSGKVKRQKEGARHILTKKSRKRKRSLKGGTLMDKTFQKQTKALLPYA